jgi:hypothetical protein
MTITANELLQLFRKVINLGYTYDLSEEDVYGGYKIVIRYWDKRKTTVELYISKYSNRYDEFNEVIEELDKQLKAKVIDNEKEERFKQYLKLKEEFAND